MATKKKKSPAQKTTSKISYSKSFRKSYAKRPLWQWILIFLIIGIIAYFMVYYFSMRDASIYMVPSSTVPSYNLPTN